jgi:iron complex outermembrane receptor protein
MIMRPLMNSCAMAALVVSTPSLAQSAPDDGPDFEQLEDESTPDGSLLGEIVVTGDRLRSQVDSAQAPIVELNEEDIAAYGASTIGDLVEALGTVTNSSRGRGDARPVFLINGIRVGSFREFRSYPPEAIVKVEVLPEEVAQRFGFAPDRRVVNFILKENYSALTVEAEYEQPGQGGYSRTEQEATLLKIAKGARINIDLEVNDRTLLTEAERQVIQTESSVSGVAGDPNPAAFRSLVSDTFSFEATGNYAKSFIESGSSLSFNGTFERNESLSLSGLNSVILTDAVDNSALRTFDPGNPLERRASSDSVSAALSYNRPIGDFQFTATADASLVESTTEFDLPADTSGLVTDALAGTLAIDGVLPALADAGFATNRTNTKNASTKTTLRGAPLFLPGGEVNVTFDLGYDWNRTQASDTRTATDTELTRGNLNGGVNLTIPIASARDDFLAALGDVTLNLSGGFDDLSDFGTLFDWSAGLIWAPFDQLDLSATYTNRESAPSISQLASPEVVTFNVSTFDFVRGETVLATVTSGGNPFLNASTQSDWTFSTNWKLPFIENTSAQLSYSRNRTDDVSSSLPTLTPAVEAAFSDRVTRDADGILLAIDQRPVAYDQTSLNRLAFGLTTRGNFGKAKVPERAPEGAEGRSSGGRPAGARRGGRGGGPPGVGGGDGRGRFFLSLNHTLDLRNEILIAPGIPAIDLIGGDGGSSRNNTQLEAGMFRGGLGLRVSGTYTGPATIDGSELASSSDLNFGALAKVDLRMFVDLGEVFKKQDGPLKGMRLSFRADNVFDGIRRVTDENGEVPLNFQPALIDPIGRYLGFEIRKLL